MRNLFGRREAPSPAGTWMAARSRATPEQVIRTYFEAGCAHDLDWIVATLTPERARLYQEARTVDKRRLSVRAARVLRVEAVDPAVLLPPAASRYRSRMIFRVEYELELVEPEQRRDPTLKEGADWAYFVLVTEGRGHPWLIADWGR